MDRSPAPRRSVLSKAPPSARARRAAKIDLELEAGSRAHYEDPAYYTQTYRTRIHDVAFYVERALAQGGPVLEYGLGNGRIALPLARHGISVTGVDHSASMLADLAERLHDEPKEVQRRLRAVRGDMRTVRLRKRFPLVFCTFNTALHLYTRPDVEAFLAGVRAHLAPGGRFLVDLSIPVAEDLARDPSQAYGAPRFRHPTLGVVRYREHFDYDRLRQVLFVSMLMRGQGQDDDVMVPLAHRQFYPQEWEALLHYNGFDVVHAYGDFTKGPLTRDSDVMVFEAKLRAGKGKR